MNIGMSSQQDHTPIYVSDLPGHRGTVRIKIGSERNSDWGWSTKLSQAIHLTPYWEKRFLKYLKDTNRSGYVLYDRVTGV